MTDDYQLRKELDNYKWLFDELTKELSRQGVINISELLGKFYDQSEMDNLYSEFDDELNGLSTRLSTLRGSLIDFNTQLIQFCDSNENLEDDLTKLKDNLYAFIDELGLLDVDLIELSGKISTFEFQLQGDETHDGFIDFIEALQNNIYGADQTYVDEHGVTQHYTIENPSPDSLKGELRSFGASLSSLEAGDAKLSLTLSALSGYLTSFKGTLSEFQDQIVDDLGQSVYEGLDEEIIKLIGAITNANNEIDAHKDLIDDVNTELYGDESNPNDIGLIGKLDVVSDVADGAVATSEGILDTLYKKAILVTYEGGASYGSSGLVKNTNSTTKVTTLSTQNNTYGNFCFSSTTSLSNAYYVTTGQGFEFTVVGHTGKTTVRFDKSDGTATALFNSDTDSDYFANNNYIKIIHTGTSAEVYVNNYLMKTVTLSDARRLVIRVENGATFSFKDLSQISVTGTDDNPATGSLIKDLNKVKDDDIPTITGMIGDDTDTGDDGTVFGLLNKAVDDIGDEEEGTGVLGDAKILKDMAFGYSNGGTVEEPVGDDCVLNQLGTVVDETIPSVQNTMYGGTGYSTTSPSASSIMGKQKADRINLYGSNQNPSSAQEGSIKYNANLVPSLQQLYTDLSLSVGVIPTGKTVQSMFGEVDGKLGNIPTNTNVQEQLDTHTGQIGAVPTGKNLQGQIGSVPNGQTLQGQITTQNGKIGTVPNGQTLQGQLDTHTEQIGDVPSGTSLYDQILGLTTNITNLSEGYTSIDTSLNYIFTPSTNFEYVFCFSQEADNQTFLTASSDYNFPISLINYSYTDCSLGNYYENVRNGSSWSSGSISTSKTIIGVGFGYQLGIADNKWTYRYTSAMPFNLFYDIEKKTYLTISETHSLSVKWRAITDYKDFYKYTDIFDAINTDFATKSHTHTIANVTNLQTTLNGKANSSDIAKSSYTLTNWETTNFSTCDVTFHKQLNMVTCIYHINTVSFANRNDHTVTASEIPSTYRPSNVFYQDICTYEGQKLDGLITVGTDGSMKIRMGTANTSMNVYGSFTYIVG